MKKFAWFFGLFLATACSKDQATSAQPTPSSAPQAAQVIRVARSKQFVGLALLELHGKLNEALAPLGFRAEWLEFPAGPQQIEAMNAGGLDIALTAESPPIFAQAAGGQLIYLAAKAYNGKLVSLVVPRDSTARSIADLRGKKVAVQKASIGHYLLVKGAEEAGLHEGDITPVFLPPPDANAAFSQKTVDGWFVWEPFVTRAELNGTGRVLVDGEKLRDTRDFYTTTPAFAAKHADVLRVFLEQLVFEEAWGASHRTEMAELLAPKLMIDVPTLEKMHDKTNFGVFPVSDADVAKQQDVADRWFRLGLLPNKVNARDFFLPPEAYATVAKPLLTASVETARTP